jgi:hypothetical protein
MNAHANQTKKKTTMKFEWSLIAERRTQNSASTKCGGKGKNKKHLYIFDFIGLFGFYKG